MCLIVVTSIYFYGLFPFFSQRKSVHLANASIQLRRAAFENRFTFRQNYDDARHSGGFHLFAISCSLPSQCVARRRSLQLLKPTPRGTGCACCMASDSDHTHADCLVSLSVGLQLSVFVVPPTDSRSSKSSQPWPSG
jgi:hypothetical protein